MNLHQAGGQKNQLPRDLGTEVSVVEESVIIKRKPTHAWVVGLFLSCYYVMLICSLAAGFAELVMFYCLRVCACVRVCVCVCVFIM